MTDDAAATVVIVSYNAADALVACLSSLEAAIQPGDMAIVVDNASSDGAAEVVASRFPRVRLVRNRRNVGFGAAVNQAMTAVETPVTILLNPDARITRAALDGLRTAVRTTDAPRLIGPSLRNVDGSHQRSAFRFPTPLVLLLEQLNLGGHLGWLDPESEAPDGTRLTVDWLKGACLAARTDLLREYGPFDERFFLFSEDVDLCRRLHDHGIPVVLEPSIEVVHVGGQSTGTHPRRSTLLFMVALAEYYRLHEARQRWWAASAVIRFTATLKWLLSLARAMASLLLGRATAARAHRDLATTFALVAVATPNEWAARSLPHWFQSDVEAGT